MRKEMSLLAESNERSEWEREMGAGTSSLP